MVIGEQFFDLTVVDRDDFTNQRGRVFVKWKCRCVCGNSITLSECQLRRGSHKSCGCRRYRSKVAPLMIGKRFGRLVVTDVDDGRSTNVICRCDCGNIKSIAMGNLKSGATTSCGCFQKETVAKVLTEDLTNKRFGRLLVLYQAPHIISSSGKKDVAWVCECDCGNICTVRAALLKNGCTTSCGCYKSQSSSERFSLKLEGQKFGRLKVLFRAENFVAEDGAQFSQWHCVCECGTLTIVRGHDLVRGAVSSCGCLISKGEEEMRRVLNQYKIKYSTQYCFDDLRSEKGRALKFDFAIFNDSQELCCLIEYQGIQHFVEQPMGFGKQQRDITDKAKRKYCEEKNIPLFEITYKDDIDEKVDVIIKSLNIINVDPVPSL